MFDDAFFFGIPIASAGFRVHLPAEASDIPRGAKKQGGLFKETIVRHKADGSRFYVRSAIHRVHQQPERTLIERDRHGVDRKVAPAKILLDGSGVIDELAGF